MYMIASVVICIPMEVDRGEALDEIVVDEIVVDVGVVCITVGVDSDVGSSIWHLSLLPTAKFAM